VRGQETRAQLGGSYFFCSSFRREFRGTFLSQKNLVARLLDKNYSRLKISSRWVRLSLRNVSDKDSP
jgi:hypothetical protein